MHPVRGVVRCFPERRERFAFGEVGPEKAVPRERIICRPQHCVGKLFEVHRVRLEGHLERWLLIVENRRLRSSEGASRSLVPAIAEPVANRRPQTQRMRPRLHEPRPVRGVLHRVGEDQCLLIRRREIIAAEQCRQRHGQQRRDGRAEEPDPIGLATGRALVVASGILVVAAVGEDGEDQPVQVVIIVRVRRPATNFAGAGVEPAKTIEYASFRFGGGVDERAKVRLVHRVLAADRAVVGVEAPAGGFEGDAPAGSAAVTAIDRGEGG